MEFSAAADELYGVVPAEFTATRQRLADGLTRDEARRFKAFRRPTVPAWAVNLLVRDGQVGPLLDLGERMRTAWSEGGDLTTLERERVTLVDDLVRRARTLADQAGRPLSDAFASEVESTLRAAIADPEAAEAVRAARLERSLSHTGFGTFGATTSGPRREPASRKAASVGAATGGTERPGTADRAGAGREGADRDVAPPGTAGRRAAAQEAASQGAAGRRARREVTVAGPEPDRGAEDRLRAEHEERVRAAERQAEAARKRLAECGSGLAAARRRLTEAEDRLRDLREEIKAAEADRITLERAARGAEREHRRAAREADESGRRARALAGAGPRRTEK